MQAPKGIIKQYTYKLLANTLLGFFMRADLRTLKQFKLQKHFNKIRANRGQEKHGALF